VFRAVERALTGEKGVLKSLFAYSPRGCMQGFLVFNYNERYDAARTWLAARLRECNLRQRLHVLEGLEQAPIGLGMLFRGENAGKLVVRVAAS
jgi:NADPH-dependent curcumin reductase CurA